ISARLQARHGIESRHPFLDHQLVEFCIALPSSQKLRDGFGRSVMRRALSGVLPDCVRWRADKTSYRPAFVWTSLKYDMHQLEQAVSKSSPLAGILDSQYLTERFGAFRKQGGAGPREFGEIWRALTVAKWLQ